MESSLPFLPYGHQWIDEDDIAAVSAALRHDFLTCGPAVEAFEAALGAAVRSPHNVAVNSGTAALHLAMMALGIGPGDAVIVPSMTFLASANAVRFVGAEVVFSDVDPRSGLMTAQTLAEALARAKAQGLKIRAVIPVHLTGQTVEMAPLSALARAEGLFVVEDACHALGTLYQGIPVGACALSDMACFSFHPVKTIAMGEGGAVTTQDPALAQKLRDFRSHGMTRRGEDFTNKDDAFDPVTHEPNPWYYEMPEIGYNYRICDILCALGASQLKKLPAFAAQRKALACLYDKALSPLGPWLAPNDRTEECDPVWHLYAVRVDFARLGLTRAAFMAALREKQIGTQVHYFPVHRQPYYQKRYGRLSLPGADAYYEKTLSLPLYPAMTEADVHRVAQALAAFGGFHRR